MFSIDHTYLGKPRIVHNLKIGDRSDTITAFEASRDVIVLTPLFDSLVRGGAQGTNAISDSYIRAIQGNSPSKFVVKIDTDGLTGKRLSSLLSLSILGTVVASVIPTT